MRVPFRHSPGSPAEASDSLIQTIRASVIGDERVLEGPFGVRRITYADYTASGRSLSFIEDFIRHEVMPFYANTHTETSQTGHQTTRFREDAREIIHAAVGGSPADVVIPCGSGSTAAINRLIDILGLRLPAGLEARYHLMACIPANERPVVFIGPYEHHSNELPWRESIANVVTISADEDGQIDQDELAVQLAVYKDRPLRIGSFSAASNVTGIVSDTDGITRLLHQYGALAFWDFAAAAPYVKIDMNPDGTEPDALGNKDAVFISPHKFIGGPGTPGLLIAKRHVFRNPVPSVPGGGTVSFVGPHAHRYLADLVHREEGGTPAIIEFIRAGLVFQLKEKVGAAVIERREQAFIRRAIKTWSTNPNIRVLGSHDAPRLSIVSFMIDHPDGALHHNFVVALLNDLFGVQARGGCSCAGPYGHTLLKIDEATSQRFACAIDGGNSGIKPGWVRVNFNYFISQAVFNFILTAVDFIATHGHLFLDQYRFNMQSGEWTHRQARPASSMRLHDLSYDAGRLEYSSHHATVPESALQTYLAQAHEAVAKAQAAATTATDDEAATLSGDLEALRWFPLRDRKK